MPLQFTRMTAEDYAAIGHEVTIGCDGGSTALTEVLSSSEIFGGIENKTPMQRSVASDHRRGYIRLARPVLNTAIAGRSGDVLSKILGVDTQRATGVLQFEIAYLPESKEYVPTKQLVAGDKFLCGAEIFKLWIDTFDIDKAIRDILDTVLQSHYKGSTRKGVFERCESEGYLAAGDWRFIPADDSAYEGLHLHVADDYFTTSNSRLSFLLNLQDSKDRLYATILDYITVIPMGMRPRIDEGVDPLTAAYAEVLAENANLRMVDMMPVDPKMTIAWYKNLSLRVQNLLVEHRADKSTRKAIIEKLAGKPGHIRAKMLGKRVDYSGRSVITIDPFLSIRKIRLPKDMVPKLYQHHLLQGMSNPTPADWTGEGNASKCLRRIQDTGILEKVPVVIGRQPTLHKASMRAFHPEITDERSIRLNPLCVTGFNADFDGDTMWSRVPISEEAIQEVNDLMLISQNLYYAKNGECSIMPRQEIIYGLNVCTRAALDRSRESHQYTNVEKLISDIYHQEVHITTPVSFEGQRDSAGRMAFLGCLPAALRKTMGVVEITSKNISNYVEAMLEYSIEAAIDGIDLLVRLGFQVGYIYPPSIDLLGGDNISYSAEMHQFHEAIRETADLYERGLEEECSYNEAYEREFRKVEERVKATIYSQVGSESGLSRLAQSGARGSQSNLVQIFAYKGRIQRSDRESFKAVIEHSYMENLTPLEHFVTAYGGRQGLINKNLNTADTGYATRKMWHTTSPFVITTRDCGSTTGLVVRKSDIAMFYSKALDVDDVFRKVITGRYQAETNMYITKEIAAELCKSGDTATIRSVLTCKKPCCKMCYGDDLSTRKLAAQGLPIGFISAQSIGEPGTQLSMDSFKKGGLATGRGITSAFAKLDAYINCRNLSTINNFPSYDPIAWHTGEVQETSNTDGTKVVRIVGSRQSKRFPESTLVCKQAIRGKGLCIERGDYDINELLRYTDVTTAQTYLLHTLYNIYRDECEISMKHFEVLVAAMTMHMIISTDRNDLYAGQYADSIQLLKGSTEGTVSRATLLGIGDVPLARPQPLSRILMEHVKSGLSSSVLLGLLDPLDYPLSQIAMGQQIAQGGLGKFSEERRLGL